MANTETSPSTRAETSQTTAETPSPAAFSFPNRPRIAGALALLSLAAPAAVKAAPGGESTQPADGRTAIVAQLQPGGTVAASQRRTSTDTDTRTSSTGWQRVDFPLESLPVVAYLNPNPERPGEESQRARFLRIAGVVRSNDEARMNREISREDALFMHRVFEMSDFPGLVNTKGRGDQTGGCDPQTGLRECKLYITAWTKIITNTTTNTVTNTDTVPGPNVPVPSPAACTNYYINVIEQAVAKGACEEEVAGLCARMKRAEEAIVLLQCSDARQDQELAFLKGQMAVLMARPPVIVNVTQNANPNIRVDNSNNVDVNNWMIALDFLSNRIANKIGGGNPGGCLPKPPCPTVSHGNTPGDYHGGRR